jgi:hypothetical protein
VNTVNFGKEVYASHDVQEGAKEEGRNHGKRQRDATDLTSWGIKLRN